MILLNDFILLNESHFVVSSVTGRVHHIPRNEEVSCKASNLIYRLACNSCKIQYTGETVLQLNERIKTHRGTIGCLNKDKGTIKGNKLMAYHFSKEICQISGFFVQIIVIIIKNPSADSNIHDTTIHGVFVSQLVRYMRVSSKLSFFINPASKLFYDTRKKGMPNKCLQGLFNKILKKNGEIKKFNQSNDNICKLLVRKVKQLS